MRRRALLTAFALELCCACGGSAPPATGPGAGPAAVEVPSASPGGDPKAPTPPPAPRDSRACCTPPGAYDPNDTSYEDCIARGGRRWGSDGCGVKPDGTVQAPPPSMAPPDH
jgi:hypothetical protein